MIWIHVFISLKITDNTARSALFALRHRMGYSEVEQLKRWEYWGLRMTGGSEAETVEPVRRWVENTPLLMNPNKHHYQMLSSDIPLLQSDSAPCFNESGGSIFVYDREDGKAESVRQTLQAMPAGAGTCMELAHGTWWDIRFAEITPQPRETLQSMALSTHRRQGLFANPHYQEHRIFLHSSG